MKKLYDGLGIRQISVELSEGYYDRKLTFQTNKAQTLRFWDGSGDKYTIGTKFKKTLETLGYRTDRKVVDDNWVELSIGYD